MGVIHNAVGLAERLGVKDPKVALLAASRAVQRDVQTSREWSWVSKMALRRTFRRAQVYGPVGLEEAILPASPDTMIPPSKDDDISAGPNWADVLIAADLSVGNPLVSALTLLCELPGAGIVVGGDVPVVFPWPIIDRNSVLTSLALAALCSPRGLRRVVDGKH
jgi:phosphotransacetylase